MFFLIQIYGLQVWLNGRASDGRVVVAPLSQQAFLGYLAATAAAWLVIGWFMSTFTDAAAPYWDAAVAAFSVTAQFLMSRRYLESWILWICVDLLAIQLFYSRDLAPTAALYTVFPVPCHCGPDAMVPRTAGNACTMTRGFILGKFLPPHAGHLFACEVARNRVEELTVLVCSHDAEPIRGDLRAEWMRECLPQPGCRVVHMHRDIPQEPKEHPEFWSIWKSAILEHHPEPIDWVFGSEPYIHQLAAELGAKPFLVDIERHAVPVSGTDIRSRPDRHWMHIPPAGSSLLPDACDAARTGKRRKIGPLHRAGKPLRHPGHSGIRPRLRRYLQTRRGLDHRGFF
ncbi:nicotinamide riboside transporter PnuC [Roseibium salinum]|nr:nicotinamide riboside transporter PnuC [Roseibium salinum]